MSDDDDVYFVIDPKEYQKLQEMVVGLQGEKQVFSCYLIILGAR